MTYSGWPTGPATFKQQWLLRKLQLDVMNELSDVGELTQFEASQEISRLKQLQKERDAQ